MFDKATSEDRPERSRFEEALKEAEEIEIEVLEATSDFYDHHFKESCRRAIEEYESFYDNNEVGD